MSSDAANHFGHGSPEALREWVLREWYEGWDLPAANETAAEIMAVLRALPVEQRMEAMGMEPCYPSIVGANGRCVYAEVSDE